MTIFSPFVTFFSQKLINLGQNKPKFANFKIRRKTQF